MGLDLFITGEPKQQAYHEAKELGLSVVCMGHYGSETFGVRALQRILTERFGVQTEWIDEPTGI
jgi:putative NIF3 family GTP cyclohydrolase 1 type 2